MSKRSKVLNMTPVMWESGKFHPIAVPGHPRRCEHCGTPVIGPVEVHLVILPGNFEPMVMRYDKGFLHTRTKCQEIQDQKIIENVRDSWT